MKIKMLAGCADPDFSYQKGAEYDVSAETAKDLINAGYAEAVKESKETATAKPAEKATTKK